MGVVHKRRQNFFAEAETLSIDVNYPVEVACFFYTYLHISATDIRQIRSVAIVL